jgi:hypothetical protein
MDIRFGHLKESARNEFQNKLNLDDPSNDTVIGNVLNELECNVDEETRDLIRRLERVRQSCWKKESIVIENLHEDDGVFYYDVTLVKADGQSQTYNNCSCTEGKLKSFQQEMVKG